MKKDLIQYPDFAKLDIRVGEVKECKPVEKSKKLLELTVDFGEDYGVTSILSGIAEYYKPEDISGKKFAFIANLEPRPMMGKVSNGMIMAADHEGKAVVIPLDPALPNGTIVR